MTESYLDISGVVIIPSDHVTSVDPTTESHEVYIEIRIHSSLSSSNITSPSGGPSIVTAPCFWSPKFLS